MRINPLAVVLSFTMVMVVLSYINNWFNKGIETRRFVACANNPNAPVCKDFKL
jgi:uncharacterized protein (DUF1499 family)